MCDFFYHKPLIVLTLIKKVLKLPHRLGHLILRVTAKKLTNVAVFSYQCFSYNMDSLYSTQYNKSTHIGFCLCNYQYNDNTASFNNSLCEKMCNVPTKIQTLDHLTLPALYHLSYKGCPIWIWLHHSHYCHYCESLTQPGTNKT